MRLIRQIDLNGDLKTKLRITDSNGNTVNGLTYNDLTIKICKPDIIASVNPASGALIEHTGTASGGNYQLTIFGSSFNISGHTSIEISAAGISTMGIEFIVGDTAKTIDDKLNVSGTLANTDNADSFKSTGFSTPTNISDAQTAIINAIPDVSNLDQKISDTQTAIINAIPSIEELATSQNVSDAQIAITNAIPSANTISDTVLGELIAEHKAIAGSLAEFMWKLKAKIINNASVSGNIYTYEGDDGEPAVIQENTEIQRITT